MTISIKTKRISNKIPHPFLTYKSPLYIGLETCFHNLKPKAKKKSEKDPEAGKSQTIFKETTIRVTS